MTWCMFRIGMSLTNHVGIVILLKLKSVTFTKDRVARDFAKLTTNPNIHLVDLRVKQLERIRLLHMMAHLLASVLHCFFKKEGI